jgi:predicted XRE-type DNA-binding protein
VRLRFRLCELQGRLLHEFRGSDLQGFRQLVEHVQRGHIWIAPATDKRLTRSIAEMGLSQREAAALLPLAQPKLSLITRRKLDDISQTKLEECLRALGHDIEISIGRRHEDAGKVRVRELV